jgi:hypothetical protein
MSKKRKYAKSPIVTGYLEKMSSSVFDKYRDEITGLTMRKQGLYALYDGGELYYVGLASNLRNRIDTHLKDRHRRRWTHFSLYIVKHEEHIRELESLVLRIASPRGNRQKGKLRRSADMLPELRQKAEEALDGIFNAGRSRKSKTKRRKGKRPDMWAAGRKAAETRRERAERPLKGVFKAGKVIYATYKGKEYKAWVYSNGGIKLNGKVHDTPSAAGMAVVDGPTCNGWLFWQAKNDRGELVRLGEFRE